MGALSAALVPPRKPGKIADLDAFYTQALWRRVRRERQGRHVKPVAHVSMHVMHAR